MWSSALTLQTTTHLSQTLLDDIKVEVRRGTLEELDSQLLLVSRFTARCLCSSAKAPAMAIAPLTPVPATTQITVR